jgi:aspartyl protease family protein
MDSSSKKVVDITLRKIAKGEVEQAFRLHKRKQVTFVALMIVLIALMLYFHDPGVLEHNLKAQTPAVTILENGETQVTIKQDQYGQYMFLGEINGNKVNFILDTGATFIAVPEAIANQLQLPVGKSYYSHTANGRSLSYASVARRVNIGGIVLFDVEASISTGLEGNAVLLGMSFLKSLSIAQKNGTITISQKL